MALTKVPPHLTDAGSFYGFGPAAAAKTTVNFNFLTDDGVYLVPGGPDTNGPKGDGASGGLVQVIKSPSAPGYVRQIWFDPTTAEIWTRVYNGTAWNAWRRINTFNYSLAANGYEELPSGRIEQWGVSTSTEANPISGSCPRKGRYVSQC